MLLVFACIGRRRLGASAAVAVGAILAACGICF